MLQAKQHKKLTARQERFAIALIEEDTKADALRKAYNTQKWQPRSIWSKASEMSKRVEVQNRVAELMQPLIDKAVVTRESHLTRLAALSEKAEQDGNYSAAVVAETNRGKCAGLYTEKLEVTGKLEDMSEDELRSRLAYLMEQNKGLLPVNTTP